MVTNTEARTPLFDDIALKLARLYYRKDRADAREIRQLAETYTNPPSLHEDFLDGDTILPASQGFESGTRMWRMAFINGTGRVQQPPHGEAGDIIVQDSLLKLQVRNDPNFEQKSANWLKGVAAAEKYNNAYVIGMGGYLPTPRQQILIECRLRTSAGFHGSTGIWLQEENTFDPKTGIMAKPFRSFGFSYLGNASDPYIHGLSIETALGLSIQGKKKLSDIDVSAWHTYGMKWSWISPSTQSTEFMVDGQTVGHLQLYPFGPAEVHLWADNYQIGRGLKLGYLNVPDVDTSSYDWVRITTVDN